VIERQEQGEPARKSQITPVEASSTRQEQQIPNSSFVVPTTENGELFLRYEGAEV